MIFHFCFGHLRWWKILHIFAIETRVRELKESVALRECQRQRSTLSLIKLQSISHYHRSYTGSRNTQFSKNMHYWYINWHSCDALCFASRLVIQNAWMAKGQIWWFVAPKLVGPAGEISLISSMLKGLIVLMAGH